MANSKIYELANKLNSMKNPSVIGVSAGEVVSTDPFTVTIADGQILLTEGDELYVAERLKKKKYAAEFEWTGGTLNANITGTVSPGGGSVSGEVIGDTSGKEKGSIVIDPKVKKGDTVVVIPTADEQTWIAVDRIEVNT